jgi:hypothetical protein
MHMCTCNTRSCTGSMSRMLPVLFRAPHRGKQSVLSPHIRGSGPQEACGPDLRRPRATQHGRLSPEMQAFQGRFQVVIDNMGVDHGGTQVRMAERLLDEANILSLAIEFRRKGMPQHVRVDILMA